MPRKKSLNPFNEPAIRADVESIVTRVVTNLVSDIVTTLVPPIVEKIVDDKIDAFAIMVANGFSDTQAQIHEVRREMATKRELNEFKSEMSQFRGETEQSLFCLQSDVSDLKDRMGRVETRMETFEGSVKTILRDHEVRIVDLEGSPA